jgi:hypothetical protein
MENTRIEALKQAQFAVANAMAALHDADGTGLDVEGTMALCREVQSRVAEMLSAERAK